MVGEVRQAMLFEEFHDGRVARRQLAQFLLGEAQARRSPRSVPARRRCRAPSSGGGRRRRNPRQSPCPSPSPPTRFTRAMAWRRVWATITLSRYITCSTGASKPVSSMLFTITMPMSPVTPSSSLPKAILKLLMLVSCFGVVRVGLQMGSSSLWLPEMMTSVFSRSSRSRSSFCGLAFLQRCEGLGQGGVDVFLVAHGGLAGGGHDLRLVAVRKDVGQVVRHHVLGLGLDGRLGFEVGVAGAVAENLQALLKVVVAEDILQKPCPCPSDRPLRRCGCGPRRRSPASRRPRWTGAWCICRCSRRRPAPSCRWACRCSRCGRSWGCPCRGSPRAWSIASGGPRPS